MARRARLLPFGLLALTIYVGCGLSNMSGELVADPEGGDVPKGGGDDRHSANQDAAPTFDGGGGVDEDAGPPPPTCQTDACALPAGGTDFGVVLYGDRSTACPTGFDATDLIEKPTGACACGGCSVTGVNCNTGTIPTNYSSNNGCGTNGAPAQANNGNCLNDQGLWGEWASVEPPAAVGGTCNVQPSTVNKAAFTTTPVRICTPQSGICAAEFCAPPPSLQACSIHNGDVSCPAGAPNKHLLGSDFTPSCAACGCSVTKKLCGGTLVIYSQSNCSNSGSQRSLTVNTCVQTNGFYQYSSKWTGIVAETQCATAAPPTPTITWTGAKTVCCPN